MTGLSEEAEALADWLGEMDEATNRYDATDEATTYICADVEVLAARLAARVAEAVAAERAAIREALGSVRGVDGIYAALDSTAHRGTSRALILAILRAALDSSGAAAGAGDRDGEGMTSDE